MDRFSTDKDPILTDEQETDYFTHMDCDIYRIPLRRERRKPYATGQRKKDHYPLYSQHSPEVYGCEPYHDAAGYRRQTAERLRHAGEPGNRQAEYCGPD